MDRAEASLLQRARGLELLSEADCEAVRKWIDQEAARRTTPPRVEQALIALRLVTAAELGRLLGSDARPVGIDSIHSRDLPDPADFAARYEVGETIGRGGSAEVRLSVDRLLRRRVAIKSLLRPDQGVRRRRFVREAQITAQLEHAGIAPIYELTTDGEGRPCLILKRIQGESLQELLARVRNGESTRLGSVLFEESPGLACRRLLAIFLKICDVVAYAHERGVVHRDLKPANVVVGRHGEVYVIDWGLAKVIEGAASGKGTAVQTDRSGDPVERRGLTAPGQILGSPAYMSPEQAAGRSHEVDHRTDIYGLGSILYEIVALVPPIESGSRESTLRRVRAGEVDPPSVRSAAPWPTDPALDRIVGRAMAVDPADRHPLVETLSEEMEEYLAASSDRPAAPGPGLEETASSSGPATRWIERHPVAAALLVVLLALALALPVTAILLAIREPKDPAAATAHGGGE